VTIWRQGGGGWGLYLDEGKWCCDLSEVVWLACWKGPAEGLFAVSAEGLRGAQVAELR
jgi:hypothetical protein